MQLIERFIKAAFNKNYKCGLKLLMGMKVYSEKYFL